MKKKRKDTSSLSAADWIEAAHQAMLRSGFQAIAVEALARDLGVTKGSFYWHFSNRDALLEAVALRWEERATTRMMASLERITSPRERLDALIRAAWARLEYVRTEAVIQAEATQPDSFIRPIHERVNASRLDYTVALYRQLGYAEEEARHRGLTTYGLFLGTVQLVRNMPELFPDEEALDAYVSHVRQLLLPPEEG